MNKRIIIILSVIIVILLAVAVILFCLSSPFSDKPKNSSENAQHLISIQTTTESTTTEHTTNTEKVDSYAEYKRIWYGDLEGMLIKLDVQNVSDGVLTGRLSIEGGEANGGIYSDIQCNFMNGSFYGESVVEISGKLLNVDIRICNEELLILKFIKGDMYLNCVMR